MTPSNRKCCAWAVASALGALAPGALAQAVTPAELLAAYAAKAAAPPSAERGQAFFNKNFGRDFDGCAACHGAVPTRPGKDLVSEKPIAALAPAANASRFRDRTKVDYAFLINCKDVVGRECTAGEKADILSWLISLKP
jgi:mono/diheme cytochrome c family protein